MAITEAQRQEVGKKTESELKQECEEVIKAAAIYERLQANSDFQEALKHLEALAAIHQGQIDGWMKQLEGTSFFKRIKIMDVIMVHQIRKEQVQEAITYPQRIAHEAQQAREYLQKLREKEKAHD